MKVALAQELTLNRAKEIQSLCKEIESIAIRAGNDALDKAIRVGQLLISVKDDIGHGGWMKWLEENFPYGKSTAENWMRLYREHGLNSHFDGNLTLTEAIKLLPTGRRKEEPQSQHVAPSNGDPEVVVAPRYSWDRPTPDPEPPRKVARLDEPTPYPVEETCAEPRTYTVDALVTIRVTRHAEAKTEEEAIRQAKCAHGEGLEWYLCHYQNCDHAEICSTEWTANLT